jgi:hypothetical protein
VAVAGLDEPASAGERKAAVCVPEACDPVLVGKDLGGVGGVFPARWAGINSCQDTPIRLGGRELAVPRPCSSRSWRTAEWAKFASNNRAAIPTSTRPPSRPFKNGALSLLGVVPSPLLSGSECRCGSCSADNKEDREMGWIRGYFGDAVAAFFPAKNDTHQRVTC